jgi:molybdopterin adenylyltransferase
MSDSFLLSTAPQRRHVDDLIVGLVSISDRASQGIYEDQGLPALRTWLDRALTSDWQAQERLIADDAATITATLIELVDGMGCDLVLTTGGTGPARRDVTPEATLAAATREMPGFGEQMRRISLAFVPTAILSRQVAVIRETTDHAALIINLPGQPKAVQETLEGLPASAGVTPVPGVFAAVPYCIDLIGGPYMETDGAVVNAFRPKSARRPPAA